MKYIIERQTASSTEYAIQKMFRYIKIKIIK